MDKISKALKFLSDKEREAVKSLLIKIKRKDFRFLDVKKLKGREDIFRIRKGKIRIIYRINTGGVYILTIERRSDKTYK